MKKALKNILLILGMSLAAIALMSRWPEVQPRLQGANWQILVIAAIGLLIYQFINAGVWSLVLGALNHRVPFNKAAKVWLQSEALRWIPGGIWGYGSRVMNAKDLGVEKGKASTSLILELILTNLAWTLTASLLLFTPLAPLAWSALLKIIPESSPWFITIIIAAIILPIILLTFFKKTLLQRFRKKLYTLLPWKDLNLKKTLHTTGAYLGLCLFNGLILWLVVRAIPALDVPPLIVMGIGGGAWLAGFWAIGVPGGIGVREAAMAGMLAVFGDLDSGIAVAILWRALQVAIELIALILVSLPPPSNAKTTSSQRLRTFRILSL